MSASRRVILHVGLPKTGTTFVQNVLYANRDALAAQGVAVVGRQSLHFDAASELAERETRRRGEVPQGQWRRVVDLVRSSTAPTVLMSCERYSVLKAPGVQAIAAAFADAELHVVVTVRERVAAEPSLWQENIKNGGTQTWHDFCEKQAAAGSAAGGSRIERVLELWAEQLPRERIHVVTVPRPGAPRSLLLERFLQVAGVDLAALPVQEPERRNDSLDLAATELLRRVNAREGGLGAGAERTVLKGWLVPEVLSRRRTSARPVEVPARASQLREADRWLVDHLDHHDYDLVGDLADLEPPPPTADQGEEPSEQVMIEHAVEAIATMAEEIHRLRASLREAERSRRRAPGSAAGPGRPAPAASPGGPSRSRRAVRRLRRELRRGVRRVRGGRS